MKSRKASETALDVVAPTKRISDQFYARISSILEWARTHMVSTVNPEMVRAYWLIGKEIVEEEQKGKNRADYFKKLIESLSLRLTSEFGGGFTIANIWNMRQFYLAYPKLYAVRREKDAVVRYTLSENNKQIFASKHKLYLPTKEELAKGLKHQRALIEESMRLEGKIG